MIGHDRFAETEWAETTRFMPRRARYARRPVQPMPWQAKVVALAYTVFLIFAIFK